MGARSFLLKGYRSRNGSRKYGFFQPLSVVEMVFLYRENRDIHSVNDCRPVQMLHEVQTSPVKMALGLTMAEIFYDCVKEEEQNIRLYDFFSRCIFTLDASEQRHIHVLLYFLLHLTGYLGFLPSDLSEGHERVQFDVLAGRFVPSPGGNDPIAGILRQFLYAQIVDCQQIVFDADQKRLLLQTLFEYYRRHIGGYRPPQTIQVFAEVFR
jgi:DNA repair protein RecO (recombination protein O)